jgi:hypothetical protein
MAFRKTPLSGLGTVSLPLPTKDEDDDEEESFYVAWLKGKPKVKIWHLFTQSSEDPLV